MLFLSTAWIIGCACGWFMNNVHRRLLRWWRRIPKPKPAVVLGATPEATKGDGGGHVEAIIKCLWYTNKARRERSRCAH